MPKSHDVEKVLTQVHDQASFFSELLSKTLDWPVPDTGRIEDIAYGWSQQDLSATGLETHLVQGSIWQIQPADSNQPWGIFVLEFKHQDALSPRHGLAGVLRKLLKGLVGTRRKDPKLPSWKREHLLFICTHDWTSFRFAYYRSKPDDPRAARLATFGWAPGTSPRTVCEFNLPALVWPEDTSDAERWVADWARAFDKEALTRDFFKRFDKALGAIKTDLQEYQHLSSAEAYTQSQLLLERLIFLYFLQNRGWLNQDRRYLPSRLAEHAEKPNGFTYYHEFLDKLFWTLSTAPGGAGRFSGIPFLNGGLFDDDEFLQPGNLRKATPPLKVRNRSMQYVFQELLEAFNFTVTEDTPLNQEVAVDPEMLGKVFESIVLHAEAADPDAIAPDKRKATGSYYTPRIVVHFICQEVLYQFLKNHLPGDGWGPRLKTLFSIDPTEGIDEDGVQLLKSTISPEQAVQVRGLVLPLKCCDPAVGSGAFPVGLMHELVNLRRLLETVANGYKDPVVGQGSRWLHDAKARIVEDCLFGADIQQQAIEICRLRLWLSLIVDHDLGLDPFTAEKSQFSRAIEHISQLPNLEMNFRRADSLHDHISGVPVVILPERASRHAAEFSKIFRLGAELHKARKAERKKTLRLDILGERLELSRTIVDEELKELRTRDSALDSFFGIEESNAKKRERNQREIENLEQALGKVTSDKKELEKLRRRDADSQFYPKLRKLEGADFDSPFNFAWYVDFPGVFTDKSSGFDIIVGNPPFVTARNAKKRALWAERWPRVCYKNYLLVCPFFELGFGLLTSDGELGFIVSNAFAKRDFGRPLIEVFFPTVRLEKIVDCSGLMFPGHGTPTCVVFGRRPAVNSDGVGDEVRVTTILSGGGDLRTPPEESTLWRIIEEHHDQPNYIDARITVTDRPSSELHSWPWRFGRTESNVSGPSRPLQEFCGEPIGAQFITGKDEAFVVSGDYIRRLGVPIENIRAYGTGEDVRDWQVRSKAFIIFPYDKMLRALPEPLPKRLDFHLRPYKSVLENCVVSGSIKKKETNLEWFEFRRLARAKFAVSLNIVVPQIATHAHFVVVDHTIGFKEKAQAIVLKAEIPDDFVFTLTGVLNSSLLVEVLKRECFSKRESDRPERDTYFEFSGGKLAAVGIAEAFSAPSSDPVAQMQSLSRTCSKFGELLRQLEMRRLFDRPNKAYHDLKSSLTGSVERDTASPAPFTSPDSLRIAYEYAQSRRDSILGKMIALQEDMDWLVYGLYGLLNEDDPAIHGQSDPESLERADRPFRLWEQAEGDYEKAATAIPTTWNADRRATWEARLIAIRDNEPVRRAEQAIYKRRWDEQWKVGNEWRCGEIAYAAEFIDAFEWWLKEKAEWWLEHKKHGGSVELSEWTQALWKDDRIQAAWPVAAEQYAFLESEKAREKAEEKGAPVPERPKLATDSSTFELKFKEVVEEETVPEGFPFGVAYDLLEKKLKKEAPGKLKKVRGKLNVPRERFHSVGRGTYKWAGQQFQITEAKK